MGVLHTIRRKLYRRQLRRRLARMNRPGAGPPVNMQSAATVGIYFDATAVDDRKPVLEFAKKLRDQGKQVRLLGYISHEVADTDFGFPSFSAKELSWAGYPKSSTADQFSEQPFDLLLCICATSDPVLEFVAAVTPARLKVGPVTENANIFDLMVDLPADTRPERIIHQMKEILKVTNVQSAKVPA